MYKVGQKACLLSATVGILAKNSRFHAFLAKTQSFIRLA